MTMSDSIQTAAENVLGPIVKKAADDLAAAVGVTDPVVVAEYEATLSHATAAVIGSVAPLVQKLVAKLLPAAK
jgi:hypothetical protein